MLKRLTGSERDTASKTLCTAAMSLVYSTAVYCTPVWSRLIDSVLYDALRIVAGCLRFTPMDHLPILSGIHPAELRQLGATLSLANSAILGPTIFLSMVLVAIDIKMSQKGKQSLGLMVSIKTKR